MEGFRAEIVHGSGENAFEPSAAGLAGVGASMDTTNHARENRYDPRQFLTARGRTCP